MKFVFFYHSLFSCWNHGNAHFLRGVTRALQSLGHRVEVYVPEQGWSRNNLLTWQGLEAMANIREAFPDLQEHLYRRETLDLDRVLEQAEAVLVHEWNPPWLVAALGRRRAAGGRFRLLFHDTHHRMVSAPEEMRAYDLSAYDGVLAFGEALREQYARQGWGNSARTWHEAADTTVFHPLEQAQPLTADLVWIGNWGDGERTRELHRYLLDSVRECHLRAAVYGVRYPESARRALRQAGIRYHGWLANHRVPEVFARAKLTVHLPRGPYQRQLPGIPTIRVFEALACGIPLISAPWQDSERLFPAHSYLRAKNPAQMRVMLRACIRDRSLRQELRATGWQAIRNRHSCAHRAAELVDILKTLRAPLRKTTTPQVA